MRKDKNGVFITRQINMYKIKNKAQSKEFGKTDVDKFVINLVHRSRRRFM